MSEIDELENCSDPVEVKRLLMAWTKRRLDEGTDVDDICKLLAEGLATDRLFFRKRRNRLPGQQHLVADLADLVWWVEEILKIKKED